MCCPFRRSTELQDVGHKVGMVGRFNDAPPLTQADVGLAIGGHRCGHRKLPGVLMKRDPFDVVGAIQLPRVMLPETHRKQRPHAQTQQAGRCKVPTRARSHRITERGLRLKRWMTHAQRLHERLVSASFQTPRS